MVIQRSMGTAVGLVSAALLAGMGWHIFYSRIGFPLITWPLWVILTVGVVAEACRRRTPAWWAAAGLMAGAGIYTYNAHPLTLGIIGAVLVIALTWYYREDLRAGLRAATAAGVGTVVALAPMIVYAARNPDRYFGRFRGETVNSGAEWAGQESWIERIEFLASEYGRFWYRLTLNPARDSTDGSGVTEMVPVILLILALAGMVLGLLSYRNPLLWLGVAIVALTPLSAVLTQGAEMRRTFVMAPFLCFFVALGVVGIVRAFRSSPLPWLRTPAIVLLATALLLGVTADLRNYFVVWDSSSFQRWVFVEEHTAASHYMRELPNDVYIYFLADRWSFDYETRRFLAPDVRGEDRSARFGDYPEDEEFDIDLSIDDSLDRPVFVLIGEYRDRLEELERRYPGGEIVIGGDVDSPLFIAYELPPAGR